VNGTILRALFEDSRQQVLDNKVFRLLIILTALPILVTFLIGFHEESISLLWGWKEITYEEIISNFGGGNPGTEELNVMFIQGIQNLILLVFVGMFGMMLCIAATAFFAPRILEKGAADTLFSKPVSRMTILMSRYFAGILFVAFISSVLVLGMYLGFWITSGYNDPGFLWGALTLVYLYAMMHAFSIGVAVFTRSSTAAILLTIFLFMICGGVHGGWVTYEYFQEQDFVNQLRSEDFDDEEEGDGEADESTVVQVLVGTLKTLHFVLPKTSEADMITTKLQRAVTEKAPQVETDDGDLVVKIEPPGYVRIDSTADALETTGVEWKADTDEEGFHGTVSMRRYEREVIEKKIGSRTKRLPMNAKDASDAFEEELEAREVDPSSDNIRLSGIRAISISWQDPGLGVLGERVFFHYGDYLYEVEHLAPSDGSSEEEMRELRRQFLQHGNIVLGQIAGMSPDVWFAKVFDWDAVWKYNIFFSIGSSLAFIAAMLGLAWLRLRRIDF